MFRKTLKRLLVQHSLKSEHRTWNPSLQALYTTKVTARQDCLQQERRLLGQPTPYSHPHLMCDGELLPGVQLSEFQDRRSRLLSAVIKHASKSTVPCGQHLLVIPAAAKVYMSQKVPYVYRQNSDYLYLSGCLEPDSALVMSISPDGTNQHSVIFIRQRDAHSELWDGPRTGVEQAPQLFGVDKALSYDEFQQYLQSYGKTYHNLMVWYDFMEPVDPKIHNILSSFIADPSQSNGMHWDSPKKLIHQMRIIKSTAEQNLMKKSCQIASSAIASTIASSHPGVTEHQLFATVDYECRMRGAEYLAYPPVVAGGERANIIHYINNSQVVPDGEMVLMDAGCEYHSYTSDITRTWPVSGKFSPRQRELYEALLTVQVELISLLGAQPSLDEMFSAMCRLLGVRLKEVGAISGKLNSDQELAKIAYSFCPHHVSHYLGMDVHDTGLIGRNIRVEPGMVVTIEPGIYVSKANKFANPEFHGMGIRIEDDILITENGPEVLTATCPKHPDDIEAIMRPKCK